MVWAAISAMGTSRLHIVEGIINAVKYIDVLKHRLIPQIQDWYGKEECIFMQDGASCHTAKIVKQYLTNNGVKLLDWPGNSPDMNPIENIHLLRKKLIKWHLQQKSN